MRGPKRGGGGYVRTCRVPLGKPVLIPLWVVVNDYPCPDPTFEPAPGESLERFLQNGARAYTDQVKGTTAEWDERGIDLRRLRHTSDLFTFKAHPSLVGKLPDPCLQGEPQSGVSDGYWLMVRPRPGRHVIRVRDIQSMALIEKPVSRR